MFVKCNIRFESWESGLLNGEGKFAKSGFLLVENERKTFKTAKTTFLTAKIKPPQHVLYTGLKPIFSAFQPYTTLHTYPKTNHKKPNEHKTSQNFFLLTP
jgi:hypothetical protein